MATGTFALLCLIVCFLVRSSEALEIITAELGQDVILPSKVPNNNIKTITAVEWNRPDLDPEYVLFYRDGHIDPNQHPSYQNRVDLQDKEMKNGDVSLILMNVTMEDIGTYECLVFQGRKHELISNINLEVHPSGDKGEIIRDGGSNGGLLLGSVVGVILLLLAVLASVGFLIYRRHMKKNPNLPVLPDEAAAEQYYKH